MTETIPPPAAAPLPPTVLITGASSGIGQALAEHYAGLGAGLYLTGRNEERLTATAVICRLKGAKFVEVASVDVTDREAMTPVLEDWDDANPIDIVICNAGISGGTAGLPVEDIITQSRRIFSVNVGGVFFTLDPLLPRMIARGKGQIAMVSSLAGFAALPGAPAYSASKAAVRVFGESLRGSLKPYGVKVNVICPGFVVSRMTDANHFHMPLLMPAEKAARIIVAGLREDHPRIAFPIPTYMASGLLGMLPPKLLEKFTKWLPQKTSLQNPDQKAKQATEI